MNSGEDVGFADPVGWRDLFGVADERGVEDRGLWEEWPRFREEVGDDMFGQGVVHTHTDTT